MPAVGRYTLLGIIGDGAMGTVHKAWDEQERHFVAIKFLHPHLRRQPGAVERFRKEAKLQEGVRHPHVVRVHDFLHTPEATGLVMEYVEGTALDLVIADHRGTLPIPWIGAVVLQVLSALGYAHSHRLIHRDVKPSNILVTLGNPPTAKIADFGIARKVDTTRFTTTGCTMGTLAFMSPEHFMNPNGVGPASDIYAMGATLYNLLTGQAPFGGDSDCGLVNRIISEPAPSPSACRRDVSDGLAAVVTKAMAKSPSDRFSTCEEMAAAVSLATAVPRVGLAHRAGFRIGSASIRVANALGAAALVLGIVAAVSTWRSEHGDATQGREFVDPVVSWENAGKPAAVRQAVSGAPVKAPPAEPELVNGPASDATVEPLRPIDVSDRRWLPTDNDSGSSVVTPPVGLQPQPPSADTGAAVSRDTGPSSSELPRGTMLRARALRDVTSDTAFVGESVQFRLSVPVVVAGQLIVDRDALLGGSVTSVTRGGVLAARANLALRFGMLYSTNGAAVELVTEELVVSGPHPDGGRRLAGNGALGGLIGGLLGGKQGLREGAAAGLGIAVSDISRSVAVIEAGTEQVITLARPAVVPLR